MKTPTQKAAFVNAVNNAIAKGYTVAEAAKSAGINPNQYYAWKKTTGTTPTPTPVTFEYTPTGLPNPTFTGNVVAVYGNPNAVAQFLTANANL